ncbi:MAG TPA: hypothetical protein VNA25_11625 [Phycisphaerae bacterium]|nr:hypothetical protein [Phycisphaerae bacterium]
MIDRTVVFVLVAAAALALCGCRKVVYFPEAPMTAAVPAGAAIKYDVDGDDEADFFAYTDSNGRVDRIAYDHSGDGKPDAMVNLDSIPFDFCRHVVIILDGFGYDVLRRYWDAGGLRLFHPPSRVIAPYPTMTDPAICDLLGCGPAPAFESEYYDRRANSLVGGSRHYLSGGNQPYSRLLQYRANTIIDAVGYVRPRAVYGRELKGLKERFDELQTKELVAYLVSSAGIGTRYGAEGQTEALRQLDRVIWQIVYETRGLVKITLMADHGHSYTPSRRIDLEEHLTERGWRIRKRLDGPRDVVYVRFGLETYASLSARSPAALAADCTRCEGVELASYADGDTVVVIGRDPNSSDPNAVGRAIIRSGEHGLVYAPASGDPLRLGGISALSAEGKSLDLGAGCELSYELETKLTREHYYPLPLTRLWRAHFALAQNVPDVILSLADGYYSGSKSFGGAVNVASTHGGLNRSNSTAFIMSTAGALPPFMRSRDVPRVMTAMTGRPFPLGK